MKSSIDLISLFEINNIGVYVNCPSFYQAFGCNWSEHRSSISKTFHFNDIPSDCLKDGSFDRDNFNAGASMPSSLGDTVCAAVSASTWVEPNGRCTVEFALAWSSPKVKFKKGSTYYR